MAKEMQMQRLLFVFAVITLSFIILSPAATGARNLQQPAVELKYEAPFNFELLPKGMLIPPSGYHGPPSYDLSPPPPSPQI
ncbi:hypothetical protein SESBI_14704 [Sesbania bispinosa]|nr:hypothetical protein SESBI_14704 [Sesbania bispinosa]